MLSKGQAFMPDFMGSILVFSVVLSIFLFSWNSVQSNQQQFGVEKEMRQDAYYTTTFLVSTQGYPQDWNNSTVEIPGFASGSDNVLSSDKLREFREIDPDRQSVLLGAENFYLEFRDENGIVELDSENLTYGQKSVEPSTAVPISRQVLINRSGTMDDAEMRYLVWQ